MDLATVNKLLTTTRSVRARLDLTRPVPPELIEECLETAVQAPQGGYGCRYQFIVVTDPTQRNHRQNSTEGPSPTSTRPSGSRNVGRFNPVM